MTARDAVVTAPDRNQTLISAFMSIYECESRVWHCHADDLAERARSWDLDPGMEPQMRGEVICGDLFRFDDPDNVLRYGAEVSHCLDPALRGVNATEDPKPWN